jgi:hypothetical protein
MTRLACLVIESWSSGCNAVWTCRQMPFRRHILPPPLRLNAGIYLQVHTALQPGDQHRRFTAGVTLSLIWINRIFIFACRLLFRFSAWHSWWRSCRTDPAKFVCCHVERSGCRPLCDTVLWTMRDFFSVSKTTDKSKLRIRTPKRCISCVVQKESNASLRL